MNSLWIVYISDNDGYIGGVFNHEKAANDCFNYHCNHLPFNTHVFEINPEHCSSDFSTPADG